jgi:murein DD-endopeptidase MepM/ murein hydrolase activator NlpD
MPKTLRIIFLVVFPVYLIAPFQLTVAIDTTTSGRILDNFKETQEEILFESLPFTETGANDILAHEYKMNGLDSLKSRLAVVKDAYVEKKSVVVERRRSLESAIATLDKAIETMATSIQETKNTIYQKEKKIQELHVASFQMKKKIAGHKKIILSYLSNIYSEGNMILDVAGNVDIMKSLILSDADTDFLLTDLTYKTLVSQLGQTYIDEYRSFVKEYYLLSIKMSDEVKALDILQADLEKQSKNVQTQKDEREKLLELTKGQEDLYQKYIEAQEQAQWAIDNAWKAAESDYQSALQNLLQKHGCWEVKKTPSVVENCTRIRTYFANERELQKTSFASGTFNILSWPVASKIITTQFHDPEYYSYLGSQHEAIDIAVPQGSDVTAAMDGYVYYILPPTDTGYSYLALKHRDGYVTVYGHLSEVKIVPYQFVKKDEVIAKSGGTPGTVGAGPMTTGPHLHFEVWYNRESVDPLRYLSLADIDFKEIPSKYEWKFITDIIEKSGTGANVEQYKRKFVIKWEDETDRQKYLLTKYATPDFRNWDMWVDTALDAQIDPSFLMCVGLAETTLGNHLKTSYNIGNIGNTDSGSTYAFSSPQEGLTWMTKTFNNKFLSKYTKLSELSRWGNEDGSIYASSNANWHNNIVKCVSALKGRFIEDGYKFRIES